MLRFSGMDETLNTSHSFFSLITDHPSAFLIDLTRDLAILETFGHAQIITVQIVQPCPHRKSIGPNRSVPGSRAYGSIALFYGGTESLQDEFWRQRRIDPKSEKVVLDVVHDRLTRCLVLGLHQFPENILMKK